MTHHLSRVFLRQRGQALVEALVATMALAVLWVVIHWLAHYQDMALSAAHASRHVAFLATRSGPAQVQPPSVAPGQVMRFFTGDPHRWTSRRGTGVLDAATALRSGVQRLRPLSAAAQPGAAASHVTRLRQEWSLDDLGILRARVALEFPKPNRRATEDGGVLQLGQFDQPYDNLQRTVAVLADAGHAASDDAAQSRSAASQLAWVDAEAASGAAGREVAAHAAGVDSGWGRDGPEFDWLSVWRGRVPGDALQPYEGH